MVLEELFHLCQHRRTVVTWETRVWSRWQSKSRSKVLGLAEPKSRPAKSTWVRDTKRTVIKRMQWRKLSWGNQLSEPKAPTRTLEVKQITLRLHRLQTCYWSVACSPGERLVPTIKSMKASASTLTAWKTCLTAMLTMPLLGQDGQLLNKVKSYLSVTVEKSLQKRHDLSCWSKRYVGWKRHQMRK